MAELFTTPIAQARKKTRVQGNRWLLNLVFFVALMLSFLGLAHPTGNMIRVGEYALWPYVDPIEDPLHHACVMAWKEGEAPRILLRSEYPASDFMLYNKGPKIYLVERRYRQTSDSHQIRILSMFIDTEPVVLWDWFEDRWRIGEGGFAMPTHTSIIFARYPKVYHMEKGNRPRVYLELEEPIRRLRAIDTDQFLLLGEDAAYLTKTDGTILREWDHLTDPEIESPPLGRNQIFDMDYQNGNFLYANWGSRSFEAIDPRGVRYFLLQLKPPAVAHWVTFHNADMLLFASTLSFGGENSRPYLYILRPGEDPELIWSSPR